MKLAYVILAYKDVEQVSRLINRLRSEDTTFVVHVCKNTDSSYIKTLKGLQKNQSDVLFCKREEGLHYYWGLTRGTLNALELLYEKSIDYDYVNLISGQDYPLKTNEEIKQFFSENMGKEFLSSWPVFPLENSPFFKSYAFGVNQAYKIDRYHIKFCGKVNSIPEIASTRLISWGFFQTLKVFLRNVPVYFKEGKLRSEFLLFFFSRALPHRRKLPEDFEIHGGSAWWSITRGLAEHILKTNKKDKRYNRFFRYTLIPDEMYFQTHAMNSEYKNAVAHTNLREIIWDPAHKKSHPVIFNRTHLSFLTQSKAIFARKFDINVSSEILEELDNYLNHKEKPE